MTAEVVREEQRILIVDDDAVSVRLLAHVLDGLARIQVTTKASDALALVISGTPDLVLLDIEMPELDGFALCEQIRQQPGGEQTLVLFVTSHGEEALEVRALAAGAIDFIHKPVRREIVRSRVRNYLALKRQTDELIRLRMAAEVAAREARLHQQLHELRQEIDVVRATSLAATRTQPSDHTPGPLPPDAPLQVGRRVGGRYEIFEVAGEGGRGRVFRATDLDLGGEVALKILRKNVLAEDPELLEWLKSEIRMSRRITHPNVVRTYDYGEADGVTFITMEYVQGVSLRRVLNARGRVRLGACLSLGAQLFRALQAAHDQGVVHRDVKPENVLLSNVGVLKVMDFGIARLLDSGVGEVADGAGTLGYMAPEQLLGEAVDSRADLYAAGVLLFECLTGQLPYQAPNAMSLVPLVLGSPAPQACEWNVGVSPALSELLASLLAADPANRPATAREVEVALENMR